MIHSIRTKITVVTVLLIVLAVLAVTLLSVYFIRHQESVETDQMLKLLCETGKRNLDYYFNSVQKSMSRMAAYIEQDIKGLDDEQLTAHMQRTSRFFEEMAYKTNGVLTYYYRIDPDVSKTVKGFWFTNLDGEGFTEHEPTDISQYDTSDTSRLVWFTVPKNLGENVWLPPYITDNLDVRVISYNVPVYYHGTFVGVAGIEIDYSTMAEQVSSLRLYADGLGFLADDDGELFYHPRIDVAREGTPTVPLGIKGAGTYFNYQFEGVAKRAAWMPVANGMRLIVSVPRSQTEGEWQTLVAEIVIASAAVLLILSFFTLYYTGRIIRPLEELTEAAAEIDKGNYHVKLEYNKDDEVGKLTRTFKSMADRMSNHIEDLNRRANTDALTSVKNKRAFETAVDKLRDQVETDRRGTRFAIAAFDCNDLKLVNDRFGHNRGDEYLKNACRLICRVFKHSPVFRTGGDEFAVILQNADYEMRELLLSQFVEEREKACDEAQNKWEEVSLAMGMAVFNPEEDHTVIDTIHRADAMMYADKRLQKKNKQRTKGATL